MPASSAADISVLDNPTAGRYEVHVAGELAGVADYQRRPGRVVFVHTEIAPAFAGMGLGQRLAGWALDDARVRGERVIPRCPFIAAFIGRHPEYADLVAGHRVAESGAG